MNRKVILCFVSFLFLTFSFSQSSKVDSLLTRLQNAADDTGKVNTLHRLCETYGAIDIAKSNQYGNIGLTLAEKLNYAKGEANILNTLGNIYEEKGVYDKALGFFQKSLEISEKRSDKKYIASALINIGTIYFYQNNFPKTLEYFQKTLELDKELKDKKGIAESLNNIGAVYEAMKDYTKALNNYEEALKIRNEIKDAEGVAQSYENIGIVFYRQNKIAQTIEYFEKALAIFKQMGNKKEIAKLLGNIGGVYSNAGFRKKAVEYFNQSNDVAKEINFKEQIKTNYYNLSDAYAGNKDFSNAYLYHKMYSDLKDSIFNESSTAQIAEMEAKYQVEQERKGKELLLKESEIKDLQIEKSKNQRWYFIGGIFLLLCFLILIVNRYRIKISANAKLSALNDELVTIMENLTLAQEQLIQSEKHAAFGKVATRMAHEIQNPLNFVNNFALLSEELINEINSTTSTAEEKREAMTLLKDNLVKINHHGKRASDIIKQLQEHTRAGTPEKFFEKEK